MSKEENQPIDISNLTAQEIRARLLEAKDELQEIYYNEGHKTVLKNGLPVEVVVSQREDSSYEVVIKCGEFYFSEWGSYDSWNGTDMYFSELKVVVPKQKTITVYE